MRITAFDPGRVASYATHDTTRPWEMRVGTIAKTGSGRLVRPDPLEIAEVIRSSDCVVIEEVGARPKQGVTSVFTFGMCVGTILGAVGAAGKPIELVTPQKWKAASRLSGLSEDRAKDAARAYATQLYPDCHDRFRIKSNHGLAEAALMARWYFLEGAGRDALATPSAWDHPAAPDLALPTTPLDNGTISSTRGMRLVAFDPGRAAAYAAYDAETGEMRVGDIEQTGIGRLTRPSPLHLAEVLRAADAVLIEEVGARHNQGVSAVFTFGMSLGTILGAAAALRLPIELVTPQRWKRTSGLHGLETEEAKERARALVADLFPDCAPNVRLKKAHGPAEAALMARWYFVDGPGRAIPGSGARQIRSAA